MSRRDRCICRYVWQRLAVPDAERLAANRFVAQLRDRLRRRGGERRCCDLLLWGSLSRSTAVQGHSDIDILFVVPSDSIGGTDPSTWRRFVGETLLFRLRLPERHLRMQNHSLGLLWYNDQWIDIVPAKVVDEQAGASRYQILHHDMGFIGTRSIVCEHTQRSRELILLFKKWNCVWARYQFRGDARPTKPLSSVHLELMICRIVCSEDWQGRDAPITLQIAIVFGNLVRLIRGPCFWNGTDVSMYLHQDLRWSSRASNGTRAALHHPRVHGIRTRRWNFAYNHLLRGERIARRLASESWRQAFSRLFHE